MKPMKHEYFPEITAIRRQIQALPADVLIVGIHADSASLNGPAGAVDTALGGADGVPGDGIIGRGITLGDFSGKPGEITVLYTHGLIPAPRVIIAGLGHIAELSPDRVRQASANALRRARDLKCRSVAIALLGAGAGLETEAAAAAVTEGALLGLYQTRTPKEAAATKRVETIQIVEHDPGKQDAVARGITRGHAFAEAIADARTWVNLGPNQLTPAIFADQVHAMAGHAGLRCTLFEQTKLEALGMHTILAVARGSAHAPYMVELDYVPAGASPDAPPALILVGKGVTFDSGGYSIKTADGMVAMKGDMAGAAAAFGAMRVIAALKPAKRVMALAPIVENMISSDAMRPGDVVTSMSGLTIEINNTDAEGRLILADALHYAKRFAPAAVVDIATLTALSSQALGAGIAASVMSSDDGLRDALLRASAASAERLWPMPIFPEHAERMKSDVADLKNSGGPRSGLGASAAFLKRFVDGAYPWAHIDMAGMGMTDEARGTASRGGTGFGVRLLAALALELAAQA
jgi:leucyl aminopeptidase